MQKTTTLTGQVTLLMTNGGKRAKGGSSMEMMLHHGLLAQVSNHKGGVYFDICFRKCFPSFRYF
jgi:hypothetical protein